MVHWFHLIALSLWIGSILFFLFVFAPAVHALPAASAVSLLNRGRHALQALAWPAIVVLLLTGIANVAYTARAAAFSFESAYSMVLALKLLLFLAMVFHQSMQTLKYGPRIESLTADTPESCAQWPEPLLAQWRRWFTLLKINGTIGPLIVLLALGLKRV